MLRAIIYKKCFRRVKIVLIKYLLKDLGIRLALANQVRVIYLFEQVIIVFVSELLIKIIHYISVMDGLDVAEQKGAVFGFQIEQQFMITRRNTNQQTVPCSIDLYIGQFRIADLIADIRPEFLGRCRAVL